jgi:hypothetical protein
MSFLVLLAQFISKRIRSKVSISKDPGATLFAEDDEYFFDDFSSPDTLSYVLPSKGHWIHLIFQVILSGVIVGLSVGYLLPWHIGRYNQSSSFHI